MSPSDLCSIDSTDGDSRRDIIIDEFEHRWLNGTEPPDIIEFCRNSLARTLQLPEAEQPSLPNVVIALALVDLEFRWRSDTPTSKRGAAWYHRKLKAYGLDESRFLLLALNELEVRSRWGDKPIIRSLVAEQLPGRPQQDLDSLACQLRDELELKFPIVCSISTDTEHRFRADLKTPCVIGRQRSSDPKCPDVRFCDRDNVIRFVVAGRKENSISRIQLKLERIAVNTLIITSISDNVPTYLGNQRLAAGEAKIFTLPPSGKIVSFGGFFMHLKRLAS